MQLVASSMKFDYLSLHLSPAFFPEIYCHLHPIYAGVFSTVLPKKKKKKTEKEFLSNKRDFVRVVQGFKELACLPGVTHSHQGKIQSLYLQL